MTSMNCLSNLIVLENLFCINRSYLIESPRKRAVGNLIFLLTIISLTCVGVNYILTSEVSIGVRMFQTFLTVEFVHLAFTASVIRAPFDALKKLDEKCGIDDEYMSTLMANSTKFTFFTFASAIIDVIGLKVVLSNPSEVFIFCIFYSAQDAELIFHGLIVEAINVRLSKVKDASPVLGSKVYRHVLVATELLNEEFTPRLLILLAVILGTTVTYSSVVMLSLIDTVAPVLLFLLWREGKTFYCLWRVCYASSNSERICRQLVFNLAKTLAFDPSVDKGKNPETYSIIHRWYSTVLSMKPRFVIGSMMSIGLSVPLHILDLSVNYILIIVQIYNAYK